jgi:hypothetical protein
MISAPVYMSGSRAVRLCGMLTHICQFVNRAFEEVWHGITLQTAIVLMIALVYDREIKSLRRHIDMLDEPLEDENHNAK